MTTRVLRTASMGMLIIALLALGCKPPPSKKAFNNKMAQANEDLAKAAKSYRQALFGAAGGVILEPEKVVPSALKVAWDKMDTALNNARRMVEDLDLPRNSPTAEGLKTAYQDYLDEQKKILAKCKEIHDLLAKPDLSIQEKKDQATVLLDECRTIDDDAMKKMTVAQKKYTEAPQYFKLVDKLD